MNNAKGFVKLTIRDADTLEIKDVVEHENAITVGMFLRNIMSIPENGSNWRGTSNASAPCNITISGRILHPNMKTVSARASGYDSYPLDSSTYPPNDQFFMELEDSQVQDWTIVDGTPTFAEYIARFNSPSSIRTINSIYATGHNSDRDAATVVKLNTPCIQNPGEVLDITYRIQFFSQSTTTDDQVYISSRFSEHAIIPKAVSADSDIPFPRYAYGRFTLPPTTTETIGAVMPHIDSALNNTGSNRDVFINRFSHYKSEYNLHLEKDDNIGNVIRSVGYGSNANGSVAPSIPSSVPEIFNSQLVVANFTDDNFAHKPIQPIQNHNKDAIEWGLDVDFLASSQGSISIDGSSWVQEDWPEFWRAEIVETGEVDSSKYILRTRPLIGFDGITYKPQTKYLSDFFEDYDDNDGIRTTIDGAHGLRHPLNKEEYGADSLIKWDLSGITLMFINTSRAYIYDADTTPALPVTNVRQCATDSFGNIWIACRNTGLYKIENPDDPQSVTITKITETDNNLLVGTENSCLGVAVGYNDSLWAIFNGAVSQILDSSEMVPTFVNYSPTTSTQFDYTGLTDGNWSAIKYIKVDRESPDNNLAVVYNDNNRDQIVWWSTNGVALKGPTGGSLLNSVYDLSREADQYGFLNVSRRGSLWIFRDTAFAVQDEVNWGEIDTNIIGRRPQDPSSANCFSYDYYGSPYIASHTAFYTNTTIYGLGLTSVDGDTYSTSLDLNTSSTYGIVHAWENERSNSFAIMAPTTNFGWVSEDADRPFQLITMSPRNDSINDTLNGEHSPFQEVMWSKYHWNGSTWERNYYQDANDSASFANGPYPAKRHNFDTENHVFTGRSMIDASDSFAVNNFGSSATATFVFSIQPQAKKVVNTTPSRREIGEKFQEWNRTIFDFSTSSRQFKLMWDDAIQGNIVLFDNGVGTTITPTLPNLNAGFYRLVVTVDGSAVNIYIDGSQIGTTITLPNGDLDLSNANSDLKAFIGCRVYKWSNSQRNSPWQSDFFRGYLENIQMWNVTWNSTDVSNDFFDISGVISSKPAANLVTHLKLTESISESKPTHASNDALVDGVNISFANGSNPNAFVDGDYYTFGVVDGVLKDNSLSMRQQFSLYWKPVDYEFSEFKNTSDTNVIESISTFNITESAIFELVDSPRMLDADDSVGSTALGVVDIPGEIGCNASLGFGYTRNSQQGANVMQQISADGYIECMNSFNDNRGFLGFVTDPALIIFRSPSAFSAIEFGFQFDPNGTVNIWEAGVEVVDDITTYTVEDTFRIRRTGSVITYEKEDVGNNVTVLYTSSIASSGLLTARTIFPHTGIGFVNVKVNYDRPANIITIGDPLLQSGIYNSEYLRVEVLDIRTVNILIDGISAPVTVSEEIHSDMITPPPGEVTINGKTGWLLFNSIDVGKTVTGSVTVIYDEI